MLSRGRHKIRNINPVKVFSVTSRRLLAKIHPGQYFDKASGVIPSSLHKSLMFVSCFPIDAIANLNLGNKLGRDQTLHSNFAFMFVRNG